MIIEVFGPHYILLNVLRDEIIANSGYENVELEAERIEVAKSAPNILVLAFAGLVPDILVEPTIPGVLLSRLHSPEQSHLQTCSSLRSLHGRFY